MSVRTYVVTSSPDDGSAIVEEVAELSPVPGLTGTAALSVGPLGSGDAALYRFPAGFENDLHNTEVLTWMIVIEGQLELGTTDGASAILQPGDVARFEDATGPGHRSRVVAGSEVLVAAIRSA
jgi:hypothetical protein